MIDTTGMLWDNGIEQMHSYRKAMLSASSEVVVDFRLRAKVPTGYLPCLVGSSEELGFWDPFNAKVMQRIKMSENEWHKKITFGRKTTPYYYRFFICRPMKEAPQIKSHVQDSKTINLAHQSGLIIHKWESQTECRSITVSELTPYYILPMTEFGWTTDQQICSNDWLLNVTEMRIRIMGDAPVKFFDGGNNYSALGIKCFPIDCKDLMKSVNTDDFKRGSAATSDPLVSRFTTISNMPVSSFRKLIGPGGVSETQEHYLHHVCGSTDITVLKYNSDNNFEFTFYPNYAVVPISVRDFLVFQVCTITPESLGFRFEFYREKEGRQKLIGVAFVLPLESGQSFKFMKIPIFGLDTSCIGELVTNCLVIKPLLNIKMTMKNSYQNHWKNRRYVTAGQSPDVTHSYRALNIISMKENTLASLFSASMKPVDFIEFSVQLSQDKMPVIYHDFYVLVKSFNKICKACEVYRIAVKDVTLAQLQSSILKKYSSNIKSLSSSAAVRDYNAYEPFLTLSHALLAADPAIGFLIVVKYPQKMDNGKMELDNYFDHNIVVDTILSVIFKNPIQRKIIFSSLDADTCILLQKKQNKYPVLFRSMAASSGCSQNYDFRPKSLDAAINFAVSEKLLGVDLLAEELQKDLRIIKKAHIAGLVVFVWSKDENFKTGIFRLQVDALVCDYILFKISPGMSKEVFHLCSRKEEINIVKSHVMSEINSDQPERKCHVEHN